jgi:hypothetical protein
MRPDERAVLIEMEALLDRIGSANDAEDHGSGEEAPNIPSSTGCCPPCATRWRAGTSWASAGATSRTT